MTYEEFLRTKEMRAEACGFEIDRNFYREAKGKMRNALEIGQMNVLDFEGQRGRQVSMWEA